MDISNAIQDFLNYCIFEKGLSDKSKISYENDLNVSKFLDLNTSNPEGGEGIEQIYNGS